jgi:hypothetical protein
VLAYHAPVAAEVAELTLMNGNLRGPQPNTGNFKLPARLASCKGAYTAPRGPGLAGCGLSGMLGARKQRPPPPEVAGLRGHSSCRRHWHAPTRPLAGRAGICTHTAHGPGLVHTNLKTLGAGAPRPLPRCGKRDWQVPQGPSARPEDAQPANSDGARIPGSGGHSTGAHPSPSPSHCGICQWMIPMPPGGPLAA